MFGGRGNTSSDVAQPATGNVVPLADNAQPAQQQEAPQQEAPQQAAPQQAAPQQEAPQQAAPQQPAAEPSLDDLIEQCCDLVRPKLGDNIRPQDATSKNRVALAGIIEKLATDVAQKNDIPIDALNIRNVVTVLLNEVLTSVKTKGTVGDGPAPSAEAKPKVSKVAGSMQESQLTIQKLLLERIDSAAAVKMERADLKRQVEEVVGEILNEEKMRLNGAEQRQMVDSLVDDMLGLGPLEPLIADEAITDIMVNGPYQIYVEKNGKLQLTDVKFRDNQHVLNICTRIVTKVGRRVDESSPLCDARLLDGSRVNIIIPPLAIDGAAISIRKFSKQKITFDQMVGSSMSEDMATVLRIAGRVRLNTVVSGGTGSGKTTLLNALSSMIGEDERTITIEDAAELQLMQPHVVRLETRPANLEGKGEINQQDLVKNCLRMRPERIILGEIRGGEALDMLSAMNTGHDGSMGTLHANTPREAISRLENMCAMSGTKLPNEAVRKQIAAAVNMIVQISRMRDGGRRLQKITEVTGMEGDVVTMQDLFSYEFIGEDENGKLIGEWKKHGVRPHFTPRAQYYGLDKELLEACL
ncbi:MAG: CpaF family protein [Proteobacteria bacterium]|nr:CpaF family protein [Pseudomonadota bacterium]